MAFCEEEREFVILAIGEPEAVELDNLLNGAVHAAKIDDQLTVDVDPHIVVAAESEGLCAVGVLGEPRLQLVVEVEVPIRGSTGIAEQLPFDREEPTERNARWIGVGIEDIPSVSVPLKCEGQRGGDIQHEVVFEPSREGLSRGDAARVGRGAILLARDVAARGVVEAPTDILAGTVAPLRTRLHLEAAAFEDGLLVCAKRRLHIVAVVSEAADRLALEVRMPVRARALAEVAYDADQCDRSRGRARERRCWLRTRMRERCR